MAITFKQKTESLLASLLAELLVAGDLADCTYKALRARDFDDGSTHYSELTPLAMLRDRIEAITERVSDLDAEQVLAEYYRNGGE